MHVLTKDSMQYVYLILCIEICWSEDVGINVVVDFIICIFFIIIIEGYWCMREEDAREAGVGQDEREM